MNVLLFERFALLLYYSSNNCAHDLSLPNPLFYRLGATYCH